MAMSEFENRRVEKLVAGFVERHRPAAHLRTQLDIIWRRSGQSVEILERRPLWQGAPGQFMDHPVAKATFVKLHQHWRVFWMRADLKWHRYPLAPEVDTIEQFLALVDADTHACFWG